MITLLKKRGGFALIEFIIVIAIFAGILLVIANFSRNAAVLSNLINQNLQVEQDLEQTFQTIVTEIRSMGPSVQGAYPIESATTSSLVFFSDVDEDGVSERVRYTIGTSTVVRGITEPAGNPAVYSTSTEAVKTVVSNLFTTSSTFEYFDSSYTGTGAPLSSPIDISKIRLVRVTISADVSPTSAPKPTTFTNMIMVRNLKED